MQEIMCLENAKQLICQEHKLYVKRRIRRRCIIRCDYSQQVKELMYQDTDLKHNKQTTRSYRKKLSLRRALF